jgi:HSP20 family protein
MAMMTWRRPAWERGLWSELRDFERAMNRVFGDVYPVRTEYPPVNVWVGENDIVLTAEMPGVNAEDLDISVQEKTLTLRCARKEQEVEEGATYHRQECPRGGFARSWQMPFEIEHAKVEARMENGILRLMLPRSEASKPKKVKVKAAHGP